VAPVSVPLPKLARALRVITNCSKLKTYGVRVYSKFRKNGSTESNLERGYTHTRTHTKQHCHSTPYFLPSRRESLLKTYLNFKLTGSDKFRRHEAGEVRLLTIPEDPQFLGSMK